MAHMEDIATLFHLHQLSLLQIMLAHADQLSTGQDYKTDLLIPRELGGFWVASAQQARRVGLQG